MSEQPRHYGFLSPKRDRVMRMLILDHLRRDLKYVEFENLDLNFLEPLRKEVDDALANIKEWQPWQPQGQQEEA